MRRFLPALIAMLVVTAVSGFVPIAEGRDHLNGDYAFTTFRACTVANNPFIIDPSGASTIIPAGPIVRQNTVDSGIITFNPDGTGVSVGRSETMNISATGGSILGINEFTTPFTYTIDGDDTIIFHFDTATFASILGSGAGNTGTLEPRTGRAQIGKGANTIVSGPAAQIEQEVVHINMVNDGTIIQYRLCVRSSLNARMRVDRDDD
jgi:hypothetical protein